ncbi:MAG TPA: BadF/BadG/BcrA/BcrD ATPase family protein [Ktedonobacterales bacterium]|jgi:N-acetylglucosamine kinase-like BadF-type ATPase
MTSISADKHPNPHFLGIDGGGSKTLAVIVDAQGIERGRALAGSANYAAVGVEQAIKHLHAAAEQAAACAACRLPLKAAWLGLAGVDRPGDLALLLPWLQSLADFIRLTNDAELLLSALDDAVGVALVAGTGSIALGRDARGVITRAGGWGHILGDEGSGYDIGRLALQTATRAADGRGEATALLEHIMTHWNLDRPDDMIGRVYNNDDKAEIARLSSLVFLAARAGDHAARKITRHAADELALAAITVCNALDFSGGRVALALGGGLFLHEAAFRSQTLRRIRRRQPLGRVAIVDQPALSAARAAIHLETASTWANKPAHNVSQRR